MKRAIAPTLSLIVQALGVDNEDRFDARRELRSLKAVARVAVLIRDRLTIPPTPDAEWLLLMRQNLDRALSRLTPAPARKRRTTP